MRLIVGLGNPGEKYAGNRHNVGFMAVDRLVGRHGFGAWRSRFQGETADGSLAGEKLLILKPATYMNESGRSVGEVARFFKLSPADVIVVYDELDLAPAKVKVKQGGGHGGHNGLKSIDAHLGADYWRVRIGIGHPGDKAKVVGHVLSDFAKAEWPQFDRLLDAVSDRFDLMVAGKPSDFTAKLAMDVRPAAETPPNTKAAVPQPTNASDTPRDEPSPNGLAGNGLAGQLKRWLGGGANTKD